MTPIRPSRTGVGLRLVAVMAFALATAALIAPSGAAAAEPRRDASARPPGPVGSPGADRPVSNAVVISGHTLRFGPSLESTALDVIPAGSVVAILGEPENGFVPVTFDGMSGYAVSADLAGGGAATTPPATAAAGPTEDATGGETVPAVASGQTDVVSIIYAAAAAYGQPGADMLRVASCESNLDPGAVNPAGTYGLFQFVPSTWATTPYAGYDIFDPVANANAAAWMWSVGRRGEWVCQ